uniref:Uncharacterized protein n=1 Tax=Monopterus albus TaxID=43700 RepID=A0A3Q3IJN6_MONAL
SNFSSLKILSNVTETRRSDLCCFLLFVTRVYTHSGYCVKPLPPTIDPLESGGALFTKSPDTACGCVGVFTYDLQSQFTKQFSSAKVAVMFSNPFDLSHDVNMFAVGVFDKDKKCDYDLYKEMRYGEEEGFVRGKAKNGILTYKSDEVNIRATMSDSDQPVIKVQLLPSHKLDA